MDNNTQKNPLNGKKIALFVVYGIVAVLLLITVLSFNDLPGIIEQVKKVDVGYVLLAILMVVIYLALYPLSLCILTKAKKTKVSMPITYVIAMTEHFFNGITPWATGGQPFQAHSFSKAKVKLSESTGLLLTNLAIYMIATTGFSMLGLFNIDTLTAYIDPVWIPIIIVGYAMNFLVLVVTVVLGTSKTVCGWLMKFVCFLCKFRIFKKLETKKDDLNTYFEQTQDAFHSLTKKKGHFVLALLSKLLAYVFLYSAAYFILLSMNIPVEPAHVFLVMSGTSFAATAVGFVPTPGASGGIEGAAGQVFKSIILFIVGGSVATSVVTMANGVMLIWRLLSYYFVLLVSLLFYVGLEIYFARKRSKNKNADKE